MKKAVITLLSLTTLVSLSNAQQINLSWANVTHATNAFSFDIVMSPGAGYDATTVANAGNLRFDVSTGDTPLITSVAASDVQVGYTSSGQISVPGSPPAGSQEFGVAWSQPGGQAGDLLLDPGTPFKLARITVVYEGPIDPSATFTLRPFTGLSGQSFWSYGGGTNAGYSAPPSTPLPVMLVSFDIFNEGSFARLNWTTSEEVDSKLFEVQYSVDAKAWSKVGEVKSAGNSRQSNHYTYVHQAFSGGTNYYRLKMIDTDLSFTYSQIRSLMQNTGDSFVIFPNPAAGKVFIRTDRPVKSATLFNRDGKVISAFPNIGIDGIETSRYPAGIYLLTITDDQGTSRSQELLILH